MEKGDLINRIQGHITTATVSDAEELCIVGSGDRPDDQLILFRYWLNEPQCWLRGAFSASGDPIWEEDDYERFQRAIGEID
jgi:hypothetical protein